MSFGSMVKPARQNNYDSLSQPGSFDIKCSIPKAGKPQNQRKVAIQPSIFILLSLSEFKH